MFPKSPDDRIALRDHSELVPIYRWGWSKTVNPCIEKSPDHRPFICLVLQYCLCGERVADHDVQRWTIEPLSHITWVYYGSHWYTPRVKINEGLIIIRLGRTARYVARFVCPRGWKWWSSHEWGPYCGTYTHGWNLARIYIVYWAWRTS